MFSKGHAPPGCLLKALMRRGEICRMCLLQCLSYYTGQSFQFFRTQCNPLNSMGLYDFRKISPGLHEASPKAILAVNLSFTPYEGVVFFRHFHTPSEGVENAHPRYRHQRTIFAVNLPFTPFEGVAFSGISLLLPKEWWTLTFAADTRRAILTNLLRGALSFSTA